MRELTSSILLAVAIIKQGPSHLEKLESFLATMTYADRVTLAGYCRNYNIDAPMIVHFDYTDQKWLWDDRRELMPN